MLKEAYLDNATCTQPSDQVIEQSLIYLKEKWGAFSAPHKRGTQLQPIIQESYEKIYDLLGVSKNGSFILCSSGVEAINHVIFSVFKSITRQTGKNQFITAQSDEAAQLMCFSHLEELSCHCRYVELNENGHITPEALEDVLNPRTALVTLSSANAMTGVLHPIEEIARVCKDRGVLLHLDISHTLGRLPFDFSQIMPDFITFNAELLHGPRACGGLYIRENLSLDPFIYGAMDQGGLRGGALDVASLVGLGVAAREAKNALDFTGMEMTRLRQYFEKELLQISDRISLPFSHLPRLPQTTCLLFDGLVNEALLFFLNERRVYASFGGGSYQKIALLLQLSGVSKSRSHSGLNLTLSKFTSEQELNLALEAIKEAYQYFF